MDKNQKISVVIPVYNSQDSIQECLASVLNQTAIELIHEIIIINDGSTDNSLFIIQNFKEKTNNLNISIINQENQGVSSARNNGMKIATGKYIALLDSDDVWLPRKIERQMEVMSSNPYIDFLGCDSDKNGTKILTKKIKSLYKANIKDLCIKCFPSTPAALFKKEIVDKIGYFDEEQKYGEDMNYFNKICCEFNYYHLPEYLVYTGGGKPQFGHSGLSANLVGMHYGNLKNIKELKDRREINKSFYSIIYIFYWIKHFRRIAITKARKN